VIILAEISVKGHYETFDESHMENLERSSPLKNMILYSLDGPLLKMSSLDHKDAIFLV